MTDSDWNPRDLLVRTASHVGVKGDPFAAVISHIERRRRRGKLAATCAAVVCLVSAAGLIGHADWPDSQPARLSSSADPVANWPPRGPFVKETGLTGQVSAAWNNAESVRTTTIRLLYAGPVAGTRFVVALGLQRHTEHVAFLSTADDGKEAQGSTVSRGDLYLRADQPVPGDPAAAALGLASSHLGAGVGAATPGGSVVLFGLASPSATAIDMESTSVDEQLTTTPETGAIADWQTLFPDSIAATDYAKVKIAGQQPSVTSTIYSGIGDPYQRRCQARADGSRADTLELSCGADLGVRAGDWVSDIHGVIGEVTHVEHHRASAQSVWSPAFHTVVRAALTGVRGTVSWQGASLILTSPSASTLQAGNRIVVTGNPALTLGNVASSPGTNTSVPVAPLALHDGTASVTIVRTSGPPGGEH